MPQPRVTHGAASSGPAPALLREWDVPAEFAARPIFDTLAYLEARAGPKVVVIGDSGAGKSSLVDRLVRGTYDKHRPGTAGRVIMGTYAQPHTATQPHSHAHARHAKHTQTVTPCAATHPCKLV